MIYRYLCQYDCVTFYNLVKSLHSTEMAMKSGGWMLLPSAETLFIESKRRIMKQTSSSSESQKKKLKNDTDDPKPKGKNIGNSKD